MIDWVYAICNEDGVRARHMRTHPILMAACIKKRICFSMTRRGAVAHTHATSPVQHITWAVVARARQTQPSSTAAAAAAVKKTNVHETNLFYVSFENQHFSLMSPLMNLARAP